MRRIVALLALVLASVVTTSVPQAAGLPLPGAATADKPQVLVWGGTYGFRHPSITSGELAFTQLAAETGAFDVVVTENPALLTLSVLREFDALAWISTTGKAPMTEQQREDVIRWSSCGGGNLGFHAALDGEYGWGERAELFGAQFDSHPKGAGSGEARMLVEDGEHPITEGWHGRDSFLLDDEYYRWRSAKRVPGVSLPRNDAATDVLLSLDETTVGGGIQDGPLAYEEHQPIAWAKTFRDGGRVYYNNMGHSESTWSEPEFRTSIVNGVGWVSEVRPDQECLDGTEDVSTKHEPPAADPGTVGRPCDVPAVGTRDGVPWEQSGALRVLTEGGDGVELAPGLLGGLAWGAQTWLLDLSSSGAASADVDLRLAWPVPVDDYDLSVTTAWGFYGSDAPAGGASEELLLADVPHCAVLHVAGDNMLAVSGQAPTVTAAVTPAVEAGVAPGPEAGADGGDPAPGQDVRATTAAVASRSLPATGPAAAWGAGGVLALSLSALGARRHRSRD